MGTSDLESDFRGIGNDAAVATRDHGRLGRFHAGSHLNTHRQKTTHRHMDEALRGGWA